jgi:hypothetical protein
VRRQYRAGGRIRGVGRQFGMERHPSHLARAHRRMQAGRPAGHVRAGTVVDYAFGHGRGMGGDVMCRRRIAAMTAVVHVPVAGTFGASARVASIMRERN